MQIFSQFDVLSPLQALPRRRVSVAVVPKFNLLNIPGQTPATAGPGPVPVPGQSPTTGSTTGPNLGPNTGPVTGAALPVLVGFPVLSGNEAWWHIKWHPLTRSYTGVRNISFYFRMDSGNCLSHIDIMFTGDKLEIVLEVISILSVSDGK